VNSQAPDRLIITGLQDVKEMRKGHKFGEITAIRGKIICGVSERATSGEQS